MEPGHEDREYFTSCAQPAEGSAASMEPGHEDREYPLEVPPASTTGRASMEPGHEDREYLEREKNGSYSAASLNGARS